MSTSDEMLLNSMTALVSAHGKAISRFGASVVVMTKFVEAVLPQLSTAQIERTILAFRAQLGEAMAVADDVRRIPRHADRTGEHAAGPARQRCRPHHVEALKRK